MDSKAISNEFLRQLGKRIKEERELKNFTLENMDALCDIDPSDFSKIENGRQNITFKTFIRIAVALDINPLKLFRFEFTLDEFKN
ncbi:helix-turn-helix domain-containing protein [Zunongwangia sp. H14]|uniref:helix-turn-helix domain-containing protein n=1 Tax=Zunongwangia sp. H14 TaxID=3240792 RepID=UPI00356900E8